VKQQTREHIAGALLGAYSSRIPVEPLTGQYGDLTVEDADEIQLLQVADWTAAGADRLADQGLEDRAGRHHRDNASSGGVMLGSTPVALAGLDLRLAGCNLHKNGELAGTGAGGAVLGSPLTALAWLAWLAWLANTLGGRGVGLEAGQVILPGSVTAAIPVSAGGTVTATFAGLGRVTARFSAEES
jgi:2-keto-4-pentenoate hydratase